MTQTSPKPVIPRTLDELGINVTLLREILIKTMLRRNLDNVLTLSEAMRITVPITQELIEITREFNMIETLGASRFEDPKQLRYKLTDMGRQAALDALSQSEYFGMWPCPKNRCKKACLT